MAGLCRGNPNIQYSWICLGKGLGLNVRPSVDNHAPTTNCGSIPDLDARLGHHMAPCLFLVCMIGSLYCRPYSTVAINVCMVLFAFTVDAQNTWEPPTNHATDQKASPVQVLLHIASVLLDGSNIRQDHLQEPGTNSELMLLLSLQPNILG